MFIREYQTQNEMNGTTASEAGYHEGNIAVDTNLQDAIQNFANASAADRSAFEQLTSTNAQLETQLAQAHQQNMNLMQQLQQQSQQMNAVQLNQQ